jgi:hypothetical protein
MKTRIPRMIGLALLAIATTSPAEVYQCHDITGCIATYDGPDGTRKTITFRKGDVIVTDAGWVVSTDDGWVKLRSRRRSDPSSTFDI